MVILSSLYTTPTPIATGKALFLSVLFTLLLKPVLAVSFADMVELHSGSELVLNLTSYPKAAAEGYPIESGPIRVRGSVSLGMGVPDVAYIYIMDTSGSTDEWDGTCGTVLDCVQEFFKEFHNETLEDRSAELTAVIDFDDYARLKTPGGFVDPRNVTLIETALEKGVSSWGDTYCNDALNMAANLVNDTSNTAGTTIVVFAGDGLCTDDISSETLKTLGNTGAIVHTIAVGDMVDCSISQYTDNELGAIPLNGGICTSVPDPHTMPHVIDDLIGSDLLQIEMKVDFQNYTDLSNSSLSLTLPQEAPVTIDFESENLEFILLNEPGPHQVCVRASGMDVLGHFGQVEVCLDLVVAEDPTTSPTASPTMPPPTESPTLPPVVEQVDEQGEEEKGDIFGSGEKGDIVGSGEKPTFPDSQNPENPGSPSSENNLSGGAIFGIVLAVLVAVAILTAGIYQIISRQASTIDHTGSNDLKLDEQEVGTNASNQNVNNNKDSGLSNAQIV